MMQMQPAPQPPKSGQTAELYSQLEDYLALGRLENDRESSQTSGKKRKVIKRKSSSEREDEGGSVSQGSFAVKVNGKTVFNIKMAEDTEMLSECKIMIATLLYNDQGTLVEIGNYQANGKPIILYDPYLKLDNMFLKNSCTYYCKTKSQVIDAVFTVVSRMVKNGE